MDFIDILSAVLVSLIAAMIFMAGMFVVGRRMGRYDVVDVAWGLVFIIVAGTSLLYGGEVQSAKVITFALVAIWGLRLSSHIYRRLRSTTTEDKRYVELRKKWRTSNEDVAIFLRIYMVQAALATIVCLPVIVINVAASAALLPLFVIGLVVWILGFTIEVIADHQLRGFIRDKRNKGQLMTRGLWRYSRHPNYFGELTLWWGVGIMALAFPYGWIGLIGPMVISYLIIFVSGIPPTEKAFAGRAGWAEYQRQTSVLVPWFVKVRK